MIELYSTHSVAAIHARRAKPKLLVTRRHAVIQQPETADPFLFAQYIQIELPAFDQKKKKRGQIYYYGPLDRLRAAREAFRTVRFSAGAIEQLREIMNRSVEISDVHNLQLSRCTYKVDGNICAGDVVAHVRFWHAFDGSRREYYVCEDHRREFEEMKAGVSA